MSTHRVLVRLLVLGSVAGVGEGLATLPHILAQERLLPSVAAIEDHYNNEDDNDDDDDHLLLCILRFSSLAKLRPQPGCLHLKGRSPVCTLRWVTSLYLALNGLLARGQFCNNRGSFLLLLDQIIISRSNTLTYKSCNLSSHLPEARILLRPAPGLDMLGVDVVHQLGGVSKLHLDQSEVSIQIR